MTKIAIASDDQTHIAGHFGRTKGFLTYETNGNQIVKKDYVENNFTGHAQGHHHDHQHDHEHSHSGILQALKDCKVVISRGMGRRLLEDFEVNGKEVYVTNTAFAEEAVEQYLKGELAHDPSKTCQH